MTRHMRLAATVALLAIGSAACSMTDRQTDASGARVAGSSVYAPGSGGVWNALPDPYHYRCTGQCFAF